MALLPLHRCPGASSVLHPSCGWWSFLASRPGPTRPLQSGGGCVTGTAFASAPVCLSRPWAAGVLPGDSSC